MICQFAKQVNTPWCEAAIPKLRLQLNQYPIQEQQQLVAIAPRWHVVRDSPDCATKKGVFAAFISVIRSLLPGMLAILAGLIRGYNNALINNLPMAWPKNTCSYLKIPTYSDCLLGTWDKDDLPGYNTLSLGQTDICFPQILGEMDSSYLGT